MNRPYYFDSTDTGSPVMNNAAGSLLEVVRACLKNGFNLRTVTSIVVASGVATATAATHGFSAKYGKFVRIEGAPEAGLNGDVQPLTADTNTFTYAVTGVADGTYTGTITARRAPLDWLETHTGTNKAIFRSQDLLATAHSLRIDDSSTASMSRWLGIPTSLITGIDAYSGEFPSSAQVSGGAYVQRGAVNDANAKEWIVVGDSRGFFLATRCNTGPVFTINWFGDPEPFYPGDTGCCLLAAQTSTTVTNAPSWGLANGAAISSNPGTNSGLYAPRGMLGGEVSPQYQQVSGMPTTTLPSGSNSLPNGSTYSSPVIHEPTYVIGQGPFLRSRLPGLAWLLADASTSGFTNQEVISVGSKRFLYVPSRQATGNGAHLIRLDWWR